MSPSLPPQALEAEQSVLGCVLLDPDSLIKISDFLKPDDFYSKVNGDIYGAMLALSAQRKPVDLITLPNNLASEGKLESVGGLPALAELTTVVPSASHIFEYAQIVKTKSTLRKMIHAGQKITGFGYDEKKPVDELLEESEKEVFSISQTFLKNKFVSIKEILTERFELFSERHDKKGEGCENGTPSGFEGLDRLLGGFQPSDLIILAARPSMGKTALALSFALHAGMEEKKVIGVFSLEMSKEQLVDRMFASCLAVDAWKLQKGKLSDEDFQRIGPVMDKLSKAPIFIDDSVDSSITELRAKARRLQGEHGLDLIIIDYLQLMSTGNPTLLGNRVQEISEISRNIKALARELHVPIIALSQLSRGVEARTDKRPVLSDLRDSGAIEQDADVVMMIYRDDYYNEDSDIPGITEIHVRKHRNGPVGHCDLRFDRSQMRFYDVDMTHDY
ncbi:MAG: replicative DNA helicase [Candidatus Peregrinibacteria bacterium]